MGENIMENRHQTSMLQWTILGLAGLILVKLWHAARDMFWTAFGIGWVVYWTGGWPCF